MPFCQILFAWMINVKYEVIVLTFYWRLSDVLAPYSEHLLREVYPKSCWKSSVPESQNLAQLTFSKEKKTRYELKLYWPSTIWASSPITPQCKYIYSVKTLEASENISQPPLWQTSVNVENTTSISKNTKSAGKIKCIWHSCIYKTTRNYVRGKEGLTIVKQVKLTNVLDFYLLQQVLLFIQGLILPL